MGRGGGSSLERGNVRSEKYKSEGKFYFCRTTDEHGKMGLLSLKMREDSQNDKRQTTMLNISKITLM